MERIALPVVVLILVLKCPINAVSSMLSADGLSLYKVREHFVNSSQLNLLWVGSDPCHDKWRGVVCDKGTSSIIIGLQLSHMQLEGHIPEILSQLHHLQELWLDQNQLTGMIPIELGNLTNLKSLRLEGNMVKGYLPEKLRGIPELSYDSEFICNVPADGACAMLSTNSKSRQTSILQTYFVSGSPVHSGQLSAQNLETNVLIPESAEGSENKRILLSQSSAPSLLRKEDDNESWTCLCDPGGVLGTQKYRNDDDSFTDCNCSSACQLCDAGQVLDPLVANTSSCSCVSPLLVVVRLLNIQLFNYTLSMERNFTRNFAASLHLSPLQVVPVARRGGGTAILDIYIFPYIEATKSQYDMETTEAILIEKNTSNQGTLQDPVVGPFFILRIENLNETSYAYASNFSGKGISGKLFLPAITLSITVATIALLASMACFINHKQKSKSQSSGFSSDKDTSSSSCTNLISQRSSLPEEFQVYDNSCFSSTTGCIGKASFKLNIKSEIIPGTIVRRFSYAELVEATEHFSKYNVISLGGSSSVYRGILKDGRFVAVKKLDARNGSDADREFLIEVELLSRLHHFHLVPLIGYCVEVHGKDVQRLLVYEYMPNGNLRDHLDGILGKESLNWITRVRIALGAARGLEYLHEAATPRVLHRDFKSSNILLDSKWRAKVADFGMAKTIAYNDLNGPPNSPAQILGTFGYFAPEYIMMGRASLKSDVFSFGVVLLELISGRRPVNMTLPKGQQSLVIWATPLLQDEKQVLKEIVDPVLKNNFPVEDMLKMAQLARACLQMDSESRPTMTAVVQVLATLIPENARRSVSLPMSGVQIPFPLPWNPDCSDYNFSREDLDLDISPTLHMQNVMADSNFEPEIIKVCSQRLSGRHTLLLGLEDILASQGDPKLAIAKNGSPSWPVTEYLKKLHLLTADDPLPRSFEEELLDLTEPRLESFLLPNRLSL
eukprot:Gb_27332 [translate_table: standard]